MHKSNWIIVGASSPIAKAFMSVAIKSTRQFLLIGRDHDDLRLTARNLMIRYNVPSKVISADLSLTDKFNELITAITSLPGETNIFLAHTLMVSNDELNSHLINKTIAVNINATSQLIHAFINQCQQPKTILYLSSVAGERGRAGNSFYGASKKAIDIYLDGIKVSNPNLKIISLRLGFIDTKLTYGRSGVFLAKSPEACAKFCYKLFQKKINRKYYPFFWRYIMLIIKCIPEKLFKHLKI